MQDELFRKGCDAPRPAVVHPIVRHRARPWLCLNGDWQFATDGDDVGIAERWYAPDREFDGRIQVPGNWVTQGVGGTGALRQTVGYEGPRVGKGSYQGTAWQCTRVAVPDAWAGRRFFLKFGGVMPTLALWVNGQFIGARFTGGANSFQYEVTESVQPGAEAVITAAIDNRLGADVINGDLENWMAFSGIFGHVELEAAASTHVDRVFIVPETDQHRAVHRVRLNNATASDVRVVVKCQVSDQDRAGQYSAAQEVAVPARGEIEVAVPVAMKGFGHWSPAHPNLYRSNVELRDPESDELLDGFSTRFGMRSIESRDGRVVLNGRPIFLRGSRFEGMFPVEVSPPTERSYFREALQRYRDCGFEYLRTPFIPPIEYYDMADEVGMMLQIELPIASIEHKRWLLAELFAERCNHPSFVTYSMSNELYEKPGENVDLVDLVRTWDPTRLAIDTDGARGEPRPTCDLWLHYANEPPGFEGYMRAISRDTNEYDVAAVVEHEYLNLATMPDLAVLPMYTGGMLPPTHLTDLDRWARRHDLVDLVHRYSWASDRQQTDFYKLGLETARKHPRKAGYNVFTGMDRDLTAWPGVFNAMRLPKHRTGEEIAQYNRDCVVLANLPKRDGSTDILPDWTYHCGSPLPVDLIVSNHSGRSADDAVLEWSVCDGASVIAGGRLDGLEVPDGAVTAVGRIEWVAADLPDARRLALRVRLDAFETDNQWDLWFYPRRERCDPGPLTVGADPSLIERLAEHCRLVPATPEVTPQQMPLVVTDRLEPYRDYLVRGGRLLLLSLAELPHVCPGFYTGWFFSGDNSVAVLVEDHPSMRRVPNDGYGAWQFEKLLGQAVAFQDLHDRIVPIVSSFIWPAGGGKRVNPSAVAHLFETSVGSGRILACGMKLLDDTPEARYLLHELLRYALSDQFSPPTQMHVEQLRRWG